MYSWLGMRKTVSTLWSRLRFMSAICSSNSKSDTARSPRITAWAPRWRTKSTRRPWNGSTSTRGVLGGEAHQLHPFVQGQHRMLLRVRGHRHVDLVEQAQAPVDEVHVPVGDRVERARIDADPHAEASVRSRWYRDRQVSPYR